MDVLRNPQSISRNLGAQTGYVQGGTSQRETVQHRRSREAGPATFGATDQRVGTSGTSRQSQRWTGWRLPQCLPHQKSQNAATLSAKM
jgi:hypothetical protein